MSARTFATVFADLPTRFGRISLKCATTMRLLAGMSAVKYLPAKPLYQQHEVPPAGRLEVLVRHDGGDDVGERLGDGYCL